jgi:hypothetical protein
LTPFSSIFSQNIFSGNFHKPSPNLDFTRLGPVFLGGPKFRAAVLFRELRMGTRRFFEIFRGPVCDRAVVTMGAVERR